MKKVSLGLVVVLIMCTAFVSANSIKPKKTYSKVSTELAALLVPTVTYNQLDEATIVKVRFRINASNEVVVLETNTDNAELNAFIMESMHYKRLTTTELSTETDYIFDINFQS